MDLARPCIQKPAIAQMDNTTSKVVSHVMKHVTTVLGLPQAIVYHVRLVIFILMENAFQIVQIMYISITTPA